MNRFQVTRFTLSALEGGAPLAEALRAAGTESSVPGRFEEAAAAAAQGDRSRCRELPFSPEAVGELLATVDEGALPKVAELCRRATTPKNLEGARPYLPLLVIATGTIIVPILMTLRQFVLPVLDAIQSTQGPGVLVPALLAVGGAVAGAIALAIQPDRAALWLMFVPGASFRMIRSAPPCTPDRLLLWLAAAAAGDVPVESVLRRLRDGRVLGSRSLSRLAGAVDADTKAPEAARLLLREHRPRLEPLPTAMSPELLARLLAKTKEPMSTSNHWLALLGVGLVCASVLHTTLNFYGRIAVLAGHVLG